MNPDFDLRKDATDKTSRINTQTYKTTEWKKAGTEDSLAKAGMLVNAHLPVIKGTSLIPVWDLRPYAFLYDPYIPYTVNPKLWVQGNLNLNAGLFRVTDDIYQVRGFDFANLTLIKGDTGWIVVD